MTGGTFNFRFDDGDAYAFPAHKLQDFRARAFAPVPTLAERVSLMFCATMLAHDIKYGLGSAIARALIALETSESGVPTKPAAPFRKPPLLGLWHKHFFDARFLAANYQAAMSKRQRMELMMQAINDTEGMERDERARAIVKRTWSDPVDQRFADGRATGEWIVYLPRDGKNYYLAISKHRSEKGDQEDFLQMLIECCSIEYPLLAEWLDHAANEAAATR